MNITELLKLYPIRNLNWLAPTSLDLAFTIYASDDRTLKMMDPWNRQLDHCVGVDMDASNEDIAGWKYKTTVAGISINLLIIND